jgi:transcriptional regulator with XRE-family HTH domain
MSAPNVRKWLEALDKQRRALKMPLHILADLAHVSRATVCRILKEKRTSSSLESVLAIASVLGAEVKLRLQKPEKLVEQQVRKRAKRIVRMVQGTMALEGQGITDPNHLDQLVETAAKEIRSKPRKQLWVSQCRSSSRSQAKHPSPTSPS